MSSSLKYLPMLLLLCACDGAERPSSGAPQPASPLAGTRQRAQPPAAAQQPSSQPAAPAPHRAPRSSAAQRPASQDELHALQESIWVWRAARPDDPLSENLYASHTTGQTVEVALLLSDSAVRADFRRRVHDSPLIRLQGFDPARDPWPAAPEGVPAPDTAATLRTPYAFYPSGTEAVVLTLRNTGREALCFGEDYILSRFRDGRWQTLPTGGVINDLLHCLHPGGAFRFEVRLHPRLYPVVCGRYRVSKRVETGGRRYLLTAEFDTTPFVPFTRFDTAATDTTLR